jgi:menaquinone-9 beta-reductase
MSTYDLVCVGGGLAGASLALNMCRLGKRVLVVEAETAFKDRVRGEAMMPWGVAEAKELGVYELMLGATGKELRTWEFHFGPQKMSRDLVDTTPQKQPILAFYHPQMQEAVLAAAAAAGAEVRRGAKVKTVLPGSPPRVTVEHEGRTFEHEARLVVGADGRTSSTRRHGGFTVTQDPSRLLIAGVLLEGTTAPDDVATDFQSFGSIALFFPQGGDRQRAYYAYHKDTRSTRMQGAAALPELVTAMIETGVPRAWLEGARAIGPLATFEGADAFVESPYRDGVALVGDAAASSDPTYGQGLSLTLRDVRVLRDALLATDDWDAAGHAYAKEHDRYYGTLHTFEDWFTKIFMEVGPDADAVRARVLPRMMMNPTLLPPVFFAGPDMTLDDAMRAKIFD